LKSISNIPCPTNITRYGGNYPRITLLSAPPKDFQLEENIRCYPAGHASGGFALLSTVFLFRRRKAKDFALGTALVLGWSTGGYKMLIGDHFLSHTVTTMLLAWLLILLIAKGVLAWEGRKTRLEKLAYPLQ
jgi:membrane-associated PAP2 superfamily phosphatase